MEKNVRFEKSHPRSELEKISLFFFSQNGFLKGKNYINRRERMEHDEMAMRMKGKRMLRLKG